MNNVIFIDDPLSIDRPKPLAAQVSMHDNALAHTRLVHTGPTANVFIHDVVTHEVFLSLAHAAAHYKSTIYAVTNGLNGRTNKQHIPNLERITTDKKLWCDNSGRLFTTKRAAIKANNITDYYVKNRHNGRYEIGSRCNPRMSITLAPFMLYTHEHMQQLMNERRIKWLETGITYDSIKELQLDTGYTANQLEYALSLSEAVYV